MQLSAAQTSSPSMRFLKVIIVALLAVFALFTGLFTALAIAAVGAARGLKRMLSGEKAAPVSRRARRPNAPRHSASGDVIDVAAVEVPVAPGDK